MNKTETGCFISFEGMDGSGKSTQLRLLAECLQKNRIDAVFTREPGGTGISELIRGIIIDKANSSMDCMTEVLLYAASRAQLVSEVIKPALGLGKTVVCDRFADSSVAYQGFGRRLGRDAVEKINSFALRGLEPDLTVFLDVPPEKSMMRKQAQEFDRLETETMEFHQTVYVGYRELVKANPTRFFTVDASLDPLDIHKIILKKLGGLKQFARIFAD